MVFSFENLSNRTFVQHTAEQRYIVFANNAQTTQLALSLWGFFGQNMTFISDATFNPSISKQTNSLQ
jgi:hypothetical protein